MLRRIALVTTAVVAAALTTGVAWTSAATAVTPAAITPPVDHSYAIPLGKVTNMIVDTTDGLIFYSGRADYNSGRPGGVALSKTDGTGMTHIADTTDAAFVTLGPDGKIYASEDSNNIVVIDPKLETPAIISTFSTGPARCPSDIAFAGEALWFGYNCGGDNNLEAGLATLNPTDNSVTTALSHWQFETVHLVAIPGQSDTLIADELTGGWDVDRVTVSGVTATVAQHESMTVTGDGPMTMSPDGSIVVDKGATYRTSDLSPSSVTYANKNLYSPKRLAYSADGKHVGAAEYGNAYTSDLVTFTPAGTQIHDRHTDAANGPDDTTLVTANGIAWVGDALLAVYGDPWGDYPTLVVENTALQAPTAMTFSVPKTAGRAKRIVLSGTLSGVKAGHVVITKRDLSGAHTVGTATTDANGKFAIADIPAVGSTNTYVAKFYGDQTHAPVSRSAVTSVTRGTPVLTLKLSAGAYTYRQAARLTIHLGSHDVKKVQLWAKPGTQPLHYLKTLTVDRNGNAVTANSMVYNTIFVVKFYGDYYYNARSISTTVKTRVGIATAVEGSYGTDGAYKLFHAGSKAYQYAVVAPDKSGACVRFEAQRNENGTFVTVAVLDCAQIESGYAEASFSPASGYVGYRLRAVYNGDSLNAANATPWQYVTFR